MFAYCGNNPIMRCDPTGEDYIPFVSNFKPSFPFPAQDTPKKNSSSNTTVTKSKTNSKPKSNPNQKWINKGFNVDGETTIKNVSPDGKCSLSSTFQKFTINGCHCTLLKYVSYSVSEANVKNIELVFGQENAPKAIQIHCTKNSDTINVYDYNWDPAKDGYGLGSNITVSNSDGTEIKLNSSIEGISVSGSDFFADR